MTSATGSRLQGRDDIVVDAPTPILWQVISDSKELPNWGPPVRSVEVISQDEGAEKLGSARKIQAEFGRKSGYFIEHRVEHVEGRKIGYLIDEDSFGLDRILLRMGFSLELDATEDQATRVTFSFFHDPKGLKGLVMNPVIKLQQRRNRLAALRSLKRHAEERHLLQSQE
jgi:hypothetical protein